MDHAEGPAFLCIDDGEFDFDYDDLDFTGMMAALPEALSIASDDGMAPEDETPVPQAQPQILLVQQTPPLPPGASASAASSPFGLDRVPWPAQAPAAAVPTFTFGMHKKKSSETVVVD